jgi:aryl-alcohol dehydrogenase-like predicted oxidoreductase
MQSLILGTAQWGLGYGATNTVGRLTDGAIDGVLGVARALGIALLDTAPAYGEAEVWIGTLAQGFGIQTKVSGMAGKSGLRAALAASVVRLTRGLNA